jgi:hypothetical protein
MSDRNQEFWARRPGLVWSNAAASDSVQIRAALLRPRFQTLLDIAIEFGLDRLRSEWEVLTRESNPETLRAAPIVGRILTNIEKGFASAASCN